MGILTKWLRWLSWAQALSARWIISICRVWPVCTALNRISNAFLDLAEDRASRQLITTMEDWKKQLERFLAMYDYEVLEGAGTVTAEEAKEKAYKQKIRNHLMVANLLLFNLSCASITRSR